MGMFLNSIVPFESYKDIARTRFFVDKTPMIDEILSSVILDGQKYLCFTRPRRFGKSVMANMIGAFFERSVEGKDVFGSLKIADSDNYQNHLNRHDIIYIDFSRMPRNCNSYEYYISRIQDGINKDLQEAFPELSLSDEWAVWDNLQFIFEKLKARFIFVIDEWDAIFHKDFITEAHRKKYTEFLRNLLKEQGYVEFVYMTGVLPIAKYSDGSELNMFQEYSIATRVKFCEYFGFLDSEVDDLYGRYLKTVRNPQISRDDLRSWYDGYYTKGGERVYNPRSVICALTDNELANYWTSSGTYDSVFSYIKDNISKVQDDITVLYAGGRVPSDIQEYAASSMRLETKDEIYSSMVVYGLLTYKDGAVSIPNRELMDSFSVMMKRERSLGYIYNLANASRKMLSATLSGDTETMADILKLAHDTEAPVLSYNSEIELAAVVNLVYLAARDRYRVEREDKAGEGYVDFIFYPERRSEDGIILELKVDDTAEHAIRQIKERNYALRFTGKLGEKPKYTGRILAVGISYSRKTKEHFCKVEVLSPVSNNP
ncbi:MAG: AAA family ATPase [Lachnospiraceae bacterium]|nr:AAA family ATPase [Lachnospiraceae bacterium]